MASSESAPQPTERLFPTLSGGSRGLAPERVARHQKSRLEGAMVAAVARYGYAGTSLRELVRLAGVSKSTFYEHFESKEECFLAAFDEIIVQVTERVGAVYREEGDFRQKLTAALAAFMDLVVTEPEAANLAVVESLTLGAAGVAHRERGSEAFETMIRQSFEHSPSGRDVSPSTIRAIASGIRGVVYRNLRAGTPEELPALVPQLIDWALGYQAEDSEAVRRAIAAASEPRAIASPGTGTELDWNEPPDSPRSRAELTQRERIVRAVGRLVVERGYETLSIPSISATAGTSNQTFYEHFSNKRDAFLAAYDVVAVESLFTTATAFESEAHWPEAIGAAVRALLEYIAANELFARLSFFDLQTAGPVALDRADEVMDSFASFLQPGVSPLRDGTTEQLARGSGGLASSLSPVVLQGIASGVWSVVQHELATGQNESLPELAPELVRISLTPFAEASRAT